jgi:hypothetical protein
MEDSKINAELAKVLSGTGSQGRAAGEAASEAVRLSVAALGTQGSSDGIVGASTANAGEASARSTLDEALSQNTAQLIQVRSSVQGQLDSLAENTRALIENSTTKSESVGSKVGNTALSYANSILGGSILGPIISGLTGLFGGGKEAETPAPLVKFALPPPVRVDGGLQDSSISAVDYGQNDRVRALPAPAAAPQITVNVNAMDSRSFMDHSNEIASAVRRAMLESSALNDVIGEI